MPGSNVGTKQLDYLNIMKLTKQSQYFLDFWSLAREKHENCAVQGSSEERTESESQDSDGVNIWKMQNLNQNRWSFLKKNWKSNKRRSKSSKTILERNWHNHKFNAQLELVKLLISAKVFCQWKNTTMVLSAWQFLLCKADPDQI